VCICSTISKNILAWNGHEIKCFLLQANTDRMCLEDYLLRSIVISLVSEYHHHPSVRHFRKKKKKNDEGSSSSFSEAFSVTPRYFTWSKICTRTLYTVKQLHTCTVQKIVHIFFPEKHLKEEVVYNFGGKKNTS